MDIADRLTTIAATVTLTTAGWIVAASGIEIKPAAEPRPASVAAFAPTPVDRPAAPAGALIIPVEGVTADKLVDTYADARGGGTRSHEAIDIIAPRGTPVIAAAPGTIERLFASKDGGNTIYLRSADRRTIHYYAHLDRFAAGLAEKQSVARGQVLGTVGSTGNATTPHLHFAILLTAPEAEWWKPTMAINPYPLLRGR